MEVNYASKGVAGSGLGLGIAGTALGVLNGMGGLGNLLTGGARCGSCPSDALFREGLGTMFANNGARCCSEDHLVNRYEAAQAARIAELETEVKLRDANIYTDQKLNDLRNYVDAKAAAINDKLCAQAVHNATNDAVLGCMQGQIAQLYGLTKLVVPNTSVCPGWGNVTITPAAAATT